MKILLRVILLAAATGAFAFADLALLPGIDLTGAPGSTIGWGYTITNLSADWLETTSLSSPSFTFGTPNAIFDYPVVAPMSSVTEQFSLVALNNACTALPCGIYDIALPSTLPTPAVETGAFIVTTELFSTNPLVDPNAVDLGAGPTSTANFSVTETPATTTPEPGYMLPLAAAGLALMVFQYRKRRSA
jgi:hypothetical protein